MEAPWSAEQARWIVRRAATLALCGAEPVGPFVQPDARFFPDRFDKTPASIGRLFDRMREHVGLSDTEVEVLLVDADEGNVVSSCSSGGCGGAAVKTLGGERVTSDGSRYSVTVATTEVGHPAVLTTVLSRALGQIFIREADALARFTKTERAPAGDLAAILLGLGPLVANGSAIEVKGCGGVKIHSATSLGTPEAVLGLALACEREVVRGRSVEGLEKGLDAVPKAMFGAARAFMHENRSVIRRLDDGAESLEQGEFTLRETGSSLGGRIRKLFGLGKTEADPLEALEREAALAAPSSGRALPPRSRPSNAKLEEIRALVDESFE